MIAMPTEADVTKARAREDKLRAANEERPITWFWMPKRRRYELRVMHNGQWTVLSR